MFFRVFFLVISFSFFAAANQLSDQRIRLLANTHKLIWEGSHFGSEDIENNYHKFIEELSTSKELQNELLILEKTAQDPAARSAARLFLVNLHISMDDRHRFPEYLPVKTSEMVDALIRALRDQPGEAAAILAHTLAEGNKDVSETTAHEIDKLAKDSREVEGLRSLEKNQDSEKLISAGLLLTRLDPFDYKAKGMVFSGFQHHIDATHGLLRRWAEDTARQWSRFTPGHLGSIEQRQSFLDLAQKVYTALPLGYFTTRTHDEYDKNLVSLRFAISVMLPFALKEDAVLTIHQLEQLFQQIYVHPKDEERLDRTGVLVPSSERTEAEIKLLNLYLQREVEEFSKKGPHNNSKNFFNFLCNVFKAEKNKEKRALIFKIINTTALHAPYFFWLDTDREGKSVYFEQYIETVKNAPEEFKESANAALYGAAWALAKMLQDPAMLEGRDNPQRHINVIFQCLKKVADLLSNRWAIDCLYWVASSGVTEETRNQALGVLFSVVDPSVRANITDLVRNLAKAGCREKLKPEFNPISSDDDDIQID
ncbi:MAG: hypothetical protein AB7F43_13200 [Bacteriovoracia bacterium]